jgi:hypothetical protein
VGQHLTAIGQGNTKQRSGQNLRYRSLQLDWFFPWHLLAKQAFHAIGKPQYQPLLLPV